MISEKENLYAKLKKIVARQSNVDMEEALKIYQVKIKEEGGKLKKLVEDVKYHQSLIATYEVEVKRLEKEIIKVKEMYFDAVRRGEFYKKNLANEEIEEDDNEDYPEDEQEEVEEVKQRGGTR